MNKLCLFAPQWQDAGIGRELHDGAFALRKYVEAACGLDFLEIEVESDQRLESRHRIFGYEVLRRQLQAMARAVAERQPEKIFALGGGCGIELPLVSALARRYPDLNLFWFDAHGDLNSPLSSPSGHFHGMALRFLLERQEAVMVPDLHLLGTQRVALVGTRDLDPPEADYLRRTGMTTIGTAAVASSLESVVAGRSGHAYIHIDLDVLDPDSYRNVKCPSRNGLRVDELCHAVDTIGRALRLVGFSLVENTETNQAEIGRIDRLIRMGCGM